MRDGWPDHYILLGRTPVAVDLMTWANWFAVWDNHVIAKDQINAKCKVSTVFLGLDHNLGGGGDPLLFETMIFGGPLNEYQVQHCTYAEAEAGHAFAVGAAKKAAASIADIAKTTGADVS